MAQNGAYAPPPSMREPGARGAPQFVTSSNADAFDDFSSIKIAEIKGWRAMFPDIPDNDGRTGFCVKFKFVIWATLAVALIAGAIGLCVTMVVIHDNQIKGEPYIPPGTISPTPKPGTSPSPQPIPNTDQDGSLQIMNGPAPFTVPAGWTALWWDEFNGNALNTQFWNYDTGYGADYGLWAWGNQEQEYYTPQNVQVSNGLLQITARREVTTLPTGYTFNYTSGRINTKGKLGFFGGMKTKDGQQWNNIRIEASIKAPQPTPVGLWAAYWFLPIDMRYGVWASSGELDVYEMKNTFDRNNFAVHYGGPYPKANQRYNLYNPRVGGGSYSNDFTVVTLDWTPTSIAMSQNGVQQLYQQNAALDPKNGYYSQAYGAPPDAPFDIPFYIIINLSVGGKYPGNATDATVLPNTFSIDYIRVYGKP